MAQVLALPRNDNQIAEGRLQHLMQLLPAGVLILDEAGMVSEANPQAMELLGEPLLGQKWRAVIDRAFAPQADDGHEVSLKSGRRVKLATRSLEPEPGQLVMLTDLTETRQLQQNLSHLQRLSSLGKVAASLAHQIRTPLSAALLYAANLGNPKLDDDGRHRFQDKLMARLGELESRINDLLLFARGGHTQERAPITIGELSKRLQQSCEAALDRAEVGLSQIIDEQIQVDVNADALISAMQNLVNNAIEAGATQLQLSTCCDSKFIQIRLADNGKGMTESERRQVLNPFYTTKANGTGLGLAVVQSVCRAHDGRLELVTVEGKGSCFSLVLPRHLEGNTNG